jgi:hypothetical protein
LRLRELITRAAAFGHHLVLVQSANCGYRSLEKLTSTNGRLPIRYLPLAIARCQAVGRPIRPLDSLATSVRNAAVICRPIEIRWERQFSNDASYQLIGG